MRYSLACLSDTGVVRSHNEDNFVFFDKVMPAEHQTSDVLAEDVPFGKPFIVGVFDGMGGEAAGEVASYAAARVLEEKSHRSSWTSGDLLELFAAMENTVCAEREQRRAKVIGTTATLLAVDKQHAYVANVGDSPAMLYAENVLKTISHEHTDAETLRALGIFDRKPGLTQYLGMSDGDINLTPHVACLEISSGQSLLLASDGLTEPLDEDTVCEVLASQDATCNKVVRLRDMAIQHGGTDNITVLLCEAIESEFTDVAVIE